MRLTVVHDSLLAMRSRSFALPVLGFWLLAISAGPAMALRHECGMQRAHSATPQRAPATTHHHAPDGPGAPHRAAHPCACLSGCCCSVGPALRTMPAILVVAPPPSRDDSVAPDEPRASRETPTLFPTGPPAPTLS